MSAGLNRRGILGFFAAAPIAAAATGSPATVLGRARATSLSILGSDHASATLLRVGEQTRGMGIPGIGAAIERAHPLEAEIPPEHAELVARLGSDPSRAAEQMAAEARAIATLALAFPPEIAAYRSFAPHLRRRLYAELLMRESGRLTAGEPPPPSDTGA